MSNELAINIGSLIHRLTIQEPVETMNELGERIPDWKNVATISAAVCPLRGRELWQAQQVRPDVTHKITARYRPGLNPKHRFLFHGCDGNEDRFLNIGSILNVEERNVKLEIMAMEEV